jgi:hypothetical protein
LGDPEVAEELDHERDPRPPGDAWDQWPHQSRRVPAARWLVSGSSMVWLHPAGETNQTRCHRWQPHVWRVAV